MNIQNSAFKSFKLFSECQDKNFVIEVCPRLKVLQLQQNQLLAEYDDVPDASNPSYKVYFLTNGKLNMTASLKNIFTKLA